MWRGGLRVGEALALRAVDVDLAAGELRVLHGKGDRSRTVGVDPTAAALLEDWMDERSKWPRPRSGPLFCTFTVGNGEGGPVSGSYVRAALARSAARAGIEKAVRPHGLRHTCAVELAREGVPVHVIRRMLGHSSLATTSRYIDHVAASDVVEVMRSRE